MKQAIPYYRVSTSRQGHSGLGLEAQQQAVRHFARCNGYELMHEFTEIESGKKNKRPILERALSECKEQKAILLIAKLDRLSRNVFFISKLIEANVDFKAVDLPYASKLVLHIMAAFAEYERDQISLRTKDALSAARKRGVQLGRFGKDVLSKRHKQNAYAFAEKMKPLICDLQNQGYKTIRSITKELNCRNIPTFRKADHVWHLRTVHRIIHIIRQEDMQKDLTITNLSSPIL